jgi:uncharacterized membrane protein YjjB (DUF3815 family)
MSAARNPPPLTTPVAVLSRCCGLCVRAWSKATIEAGPPVASAIASRISSQSGA